MCYREREQPGVARRRYYESDRHLNSVTAATVIFNQRKLQTVLRVR